MTLAEGKWIWSQLRLGGSYLWHLAITFLASGLWLCLCNCRLVAHQSVSPSFCPRSRPSWDGGQRQGWQRFQETTCSQFWINLNHQYSFTYTINKKTVKIWIICQKEKFQPANLCSQVFHFPSGEKRELLQLCLNIRGCLIFICNTLPHHLNLWLIMYNLASYQFVSLSMILESILLYYFTVLVYIQYNPVATPRKPQNSQLWVL